VDHLSVAHQEYVDSPRLLVAPIPLVSFQVGQPNVIRIRGEGVAVGYGEAAGIKWGRWRLDVDLEATIDTIRTDQLERLTQYILDAVQPSGLVRDSLPLSPADTPYHPASPDAAGFAVVGLCAADQLGLLPDAAARVEAILSAYAGQTPGVTPARSADGHWYHWLDPVTGVVAWTDCYTTIGSALLVTAAQFAHEHFPGHAGIAALTEELSDTTDFAPTIHPGLDGRVYMCMNEAGGGDPSHIAEPWNEFMLVVSRALDEEDNTAANAVRDLWLEPSLIPTIPYDGLELATDNPAQYAPAFWVQQAHFFNADFALVPGFEGFFRRQQLADQAYCASELLEPYRYGLTAGVGPSGYQVDSIGSTTGVVFSPEAVVAWGDLDTMQESYADQGGRDPRYRYGLVRMSSEITSWVPSDAGLVDHVFLMFGLVESVERTFFVNRMPGVIFVDGVESGDTSAWSSTVP
jgi:hypothetical protein